MCVCVTGKWFKLTQSCVGGLKWFAPIAPSAFCSDPGSLTILATFSACHETVHSNNVVTELNRSATCDVVH